MIMVTPSTARLPVLATLGRPPAVPPGGTSTVV
jgi:hypothetical protein